MRIAAVALQEIVPKQTNLLYSQAEMRRTRMKEEEDWKENFLFHGFSVLQQ